MATPQPPQTEVANELAMLLGPFLNAEHTRTLLGLGTSAALDAFARDGWVLALPMGDGTVVYPTFQFDTSESPAVVLPGLAPMLRLLRSFDPWAVGVLLHTPAPELNGRTPVARAQDRDRADDLLRLARAAAREWAAGGHA